MCRGMVSALHEPPGEPVTHPIKLLGLNPDEFSLFFQPAYPGPFGPDFTFGALRYKDLLKEQALLLGKKNSGDMQQYQ